MRCALLSVLLLTSAWAKDPGRIVVYPGHGDAGGFTISGRFLEGHAPRPDARDGRLRNLWRNAKALESDEIKGATLSIALGARSWSVRTDDDGVFLLEARGLEPPLPSGAHAVRVHAVEDRGHPAPPAEGQLFILPAAGCALISDIDDTVLHTGVRSRRRMLKNALLKNAAQVRVVDGAAEAYQRALKAGAVGVFYLSGSPQNFMERLQRFFTQHSFPPGPILLKNFGRDPTFDQRAYKLAHLRRVLARHPGLRFTLIGDSGEHDPEIYRQLKAEHPKAIGQIFIRQAGGDLSDARFEGITLFERFDALKDLCADRAG